MGELADRVDAMRITAMTRDGGITAELYDRDRMSLSFRYGVYADCTDADLEQHLRTLAMRLWVARTREYRDIWADVTGDDSTGDDPPESFADRNGRDQRDQLTAAGSSSDGRIVLRVTGMRDWYVTIQPGTAWALDQWQFAAAVEQATAELIADHFAQLAVLTRTHYADQV